MKSKTEYSQKTNDAMFTQALHYLNSHRDSRKTIPVIQKIYEWYKVEKSLNQIGFAILKTDGSYLQICDLFLIISKWNSENQNLSPFDLNTVIFQFVDKKLIH
jgi:hypothetical protein